MGGRGERWKTENSVTQKAHGGKNSGDSEKKDAIQVLQEAKRRQIKTAKLPALREDVE